MKYQIKYVFVLTYYNNIYQYLNRIIEFIDSYYDMVLAHKLEFRKEKFQEEGMSTITFGEIIPHFLNHLEIKNFEMTAGMDKKELVASIENYVLSFRDTKKDERGNSIIISLTHIQTEFES